MDRFVIDFAMYTYHFYNSIREIAYAAVDQNDTMQLYGVVKSTV
jgi:hypothetical protein